MKKIISILLIISLLIGSLTATMFVSAQSKPKSEKSHFTITNPYKNVDFDKWEAYKTQFHCHTTASDGYQTIGEVIPRYYDLDYDIVAITDHGTLNRGWNKAPDTVNLVRLIKYERTKLAPVEPLSDEDYIAYTTGTAPTTNGTKRTHSGGMLDVPLGIELNMATPFDDCHLTGYWCEYGQGLAGVYGDYETPTREVKKAGGVSMLAHIGEFVYSGEDSYNYVGQKIDEYYVNKFARLFLDNQGSSAGMGINSAYDENTRCDRILYDQILQKTIPNGVVPWGFSFSDSHNDITLNRAYSMMYMPENSNEALRNCMLNGEFFAVSHFSKGVELNGMAEMPDLDPYADDTKNETVWSNDTPMVTNLKVDDKNSTITFEGKNFDTVTWVSNGNVILREKVDGNTATLDLNSDELLDNPYMFVRFYITGENGICYSQPFVIQRDGEEFPTVNVPKTHDISTFLRSLVTVLDWTIFKWSPIVWAFKYYALGYDALARNQKEIAEFKEYLKGLATAGKEKATY